MAIFERLARAFPKKWTLLTGVFSGLIGGMIPYLLGSAPAWLYATSAIGFIAAALFLGGFVYKVTHRPA